MFEMFSDVWFVLLPDLVLAAGILSLLVLGVFVRPSQSFQTVHYGGVLLLGMGIFLLGGFSPGIPVELFDGMVIRSHFTDFLKILCSFSALVCLLISTDYLQRESLKSFEFSILILCAVLGMNVMISANHLGVMYLGLELQSLSLYVLASLYRDNIRSTEAGLKYFVLGALASGLILFGLSFIYGFSGSLSFQTLAEWNMFDQKAVIPCMLGVVMLICGMGFKLSAVPFHMWTPDVYEGAPTPVTAFFATAPKVAAFGLLCNILFNALGNWLDVWENVLIVLSMASMIVGALAAIVQTNFKRLMAYSSIGHVGYILAGVCAGSLQGVQAVLIYLVVYLLMNFGVFACILMMRQQGHSVELISHLKGLSKTRPGMALGLAVLMFSMAGIPPMAGFFGKYYVFQAAIDAGLVGLAIVGVITSVVAAYYYLRVIKIMYFDDVVDHLDICRERSLPITVLFSAVMSVVLTGLMGPLYHLTQVVVFSFMGGFF